METKINGEELPYVVCKLKKGESACNRKRWNEYGWMTE